MDRVVDMLDIYVRLVDMLSNVPGRQLYVAGNGRRHFKAADVKKALGQLVGEKKVTIYLGYFRIMEFILCEDERFTNVRWINGKSMRVITIDMKKYELLKDLIGKEVNA